MSDQQTYKLPVLAENFDHFFDTSTCGFIITDPAGNILRINQQTALWMNSSPEAYRGRRFSDLLAVASKIYFETHLWPLVRMQGHFDEVALNWQTAAMANCPFTSMDMNQRKARNNLNSYALPYSALQTVDYMNKIFKLPGNLQKKSSLTNSKTQLFVSSL